MTGGALLIYILHIGRIQTIAGAGQKGYKDGTGSEAMFNYPFGIAFNSNDGCCYMADHANHIIRKISPKGRRGTLIGGGASKIK